MTASLAAFAALATLVVGAAPPGKPLNSGPPVGAKNDRSGFRPNHVAGATAGKRLCPV